MLVLDINVSPTIDPNYLSTDQDRLIATRAVSLTRDIVGLMDSKYHARERKPGVSVQSMEDLAVAAGGGGA